MLLDFESYMPKNKRVELAKTSVGMVKKTKSKKSGRVWVILSCITTIFVHYIVTILR